MAIVRAWATSAPGRVGQFGQRQQAAGSRLLAQLAGGTVGPHPDLVALQPICHRKAKSIAEEWSQDGNLPGGQALLHHQARDLGGYPVKHLRVEAEGVWRTNEGLQGIGSLVPRGLWQPVGRPFLLGSERRGGERREQLGAEGSHLRRCDVGPR
jgi:hypothetical protein